MMNCLSTLLKCLNGPRLYHVFRFLDPSDTYINYNSMQRSLVEKWCDVLQDSLGWLPTLIQYLSPFIMYSVYKNGLESYIGVVRVSALSIVFLYIISYVSRGTARFFTPTYVEFIMSYHGALASDDKEVRRKFMSSYDFDFSRWTPDYTATLEAPYKNVVGEDIPFVFRLFYYMMATWVGKPLAYPGSTYLLNAIMRSPLDSGRVELLMGGKGIRCKILTSDKNEIDSIFVDNRHKESGKQLVITSEGNAGFYEVGTFEIPRKAGYSVLGWNHPGFGYSTGLPFVEADANAIESVFQYAVEELKFSPEDIIVYGWSIGGYPTSYIAGAHPEIGGVIIDASFDDIVPLALNHMPAFLDSVTLKCCRRYFNLQNTQHMSKYLGPVRIIRRNNDEIISTTGHCSGNRGNHLLISILESRYPALYTDPVVRSYLMDWLDTVNPAARRMGLPGEYDNRLCKMQLEQQEESHPPFLKLGNGLEDADRIMLAYYIFSKCLTDCEGGHNNPLPQKYFKLPWKEADEL